MKIKRPFLLKAALIGTALLVGGTILATEGSLNVQNSETCTTTVYYYDNDGDGFGGAATTTLACEAPPVGYSATSTDCNDFDGLINPDAEESCDGIDNNCNGLIDEELATSTYYRDFDGDGYGDSASTTESCAAPAGYVEDATDCNDSNASIHPDAIEYCNGIDDDCDGSVDEDATSTYTFYRDFDGDGYGDSASTTESCAAPAGYVENSTDCNDNNALIHPGADEYCNGIDDDCDGSIDDSVVYRNFYQDSDNDGYGNAAVYQNDCAAPAGYVEDATDCDDGDVSIHPGATEYCNDIDDDCDGTIDEGCQQGSQQPSDCSQMQFQNHGQYVSCMAHWTNWQKKEGLITGKEKGQMMKEAAHNKNHAPETVQAENGDDEEEENEDDSLSAKWINKIQAKAEKALTKLEEKMNRSQGADKNCNKNKNRQCEE